MAVTLKSLTAPRPLLANQSWRAGTAAVMPRGRKPPNNNARTYAILMHWLIES
jgi:hypothetical protein